MEIDWSILVIGGMIGAVLSAVPTAIFALRSDRQNKTDNSTMRAEIAEQRQENRQQFDLIRQLVEQSNATGITPSLFVSEQPVQGGAIPYTAKLQRELSLAGDLKVQFITGTGALVAKPGVLSGIGTVTLPQVDMTAPARYDVPPDLQEYKTD